MSFKVRCGAVVIACLVGLLLRVVFVATRTSNDIEKRHSFDVNKTTVSRDVYRDSQPWTPNQTYTATHVTKDCNIGLRGSRFYSQSGEDRALLQKYFSQPQICNGVYVEIGALNGITYSNTKFFEDSLKWTGILIEAQPDNAKRLKRNRPHSVVIPEAVCPEGQMFVQFVGESAIGGIPGQMTDGHKDRFIAKNKKKFKEISVPCRPIGRMLSESGIKAVDFFILDVEGAELMVLETMDWNIPVKAFVIEMGRGDRDRKLIRLLAKFGYQKADWNIRDFCVKSGDCANNDVFENPNYTFSFESL